MDPKKSLARDTIGIIIYAISFNNCEGAVSIKALQGLRVVTENPFEGIYAEKQPGVEIPNYMCRNFRVSVNV